MAALFGRRGWWPLLLEACLVLRGALCGAMTVSTFANKECCRDSLFSEHVLFTGSARSALECGRKCSKTPACLTFTFAQPMCQGHDEVMTPFSKRESLVGAKTYVRSGAEPTSGVRCQQSDEEHVLTVPGLGDLRVYCEDDWIVILRRQNNLVSFYRTWDDYKAGFGDFNTEFWMGLEKLHWMTSPSVDDASGSPWQLTVDLEDWDNEFRQAVYTNFSVGAEDLLYPLSLNFSHGSAGDSLSWFSGVPFSTWDNDNDESNKNCAEKHRGAWWYKSCVASNLCGVYYTNPTAGGDKDGITWKSWRGTTYSLKFAQLKIKMVDNIC